ncbi:MAG: hypothetical protein LC660_05110 [Desulfobacteraceae bacterium]|nr:hypothetical protein [Desulfobacteraceae bacterium]
MTWSLDKLHIAQGFNGHIQNVKIFHDKTYVIEATPTNGTTVEAKITYDPGAAELPTIDNKRHKHLLAPPSFHIRSQPGVISFVPMPVSSLDMQPILSHLT